ncbi:hypothetical protein AaE_011743 [Aphanomyces astaci]|uniref:Uncharacterized protein n=1 Tax=Aphanomyces astaci TaxID=112090 RepID=A0A6A4ZP08_APHAT|nr:hypothetical protein AaE_011743 [Aphanomyces astaci]
MWRQDPAGMPSMVPRRLPRHHRRSHPPTGVDINFGSYENPPHLFAWSRSPDAALEAEKSNETKRCDQVRPAAVPETVLSPAVVTDRSILVTPPTTTPVKGVEVHVLPCKVSQGTQCSHSIATQKVIARPPILQVCDQAVQCQDQLDPPLFFTPKTQATDVARQEESLSHPTYSSTKKPLPRNAARPTSQRHSRKPMNPEAATHEYWEWLHWYSSWQLYYQQHHERSHPLKRNPTMDVVAKPIPVTTCTRQKDKALPRRNSMSFWVDAGKPLAVSDGGPSRAKPHVKPRPTQSTPCWQSNANFEATRASSVATEVAVMPMAQMPMAAAAAAAAVAPRDGKGAASLHDTDKELTLEELAC